MWPIHQINNQRSCVAWARYKQRLVLHVATAYPLRCCLSRYVYDMYYRYKKISRELYQYCLDNVRGVLSCAAPRVRVVGSADSAVG